MSHRLCDIVFIKLIIIIILGREGCANSETPSNKQPQVMKQMDGLRNWLSVVLPNSNDAPRSADFWLPKWAENL